MAAKEAAVDRAWFKEQIKCYEAMEPRYRLYANTLRSVLEAVAKQFAPNAIVQTRAKSLTSFAEKIIRKRETLDDPCHQFTDLCGGRVVTHTQDEVDAVCTFIKEHFAIDWNNSVSIDQRLRPTEFGYRSVHYIVTMQPGTFDIGDVSIAIPDDVRDLKAEVQVRTLLEHAWADFSHERSYKSAFKTPKKWQRELVRLAAVLEEADASFSHIDAGLREYASGYGAYITPERVREEIERFRLVAELDPHNAALIDRIGKLLLNLGEWREAVKILQSAADSAYQPLLKDLGVALYMLNKRKPRSRGYRRGQQYLEIASSAPYKDADALLELAETWKGIDEDRVHALYRRAFEIDPHDPFVLCNFLEYEIAYRRDSSVLQLTAPMLEAAITRCREYIDVGMSLPWAFCAIGMFDLLMKAPCLSLAAYAKAISLNSAGWMIARSLQAIRRLTVIRDELPGYEWIERFHLVACANAEKERGRTALRRIKQLAKPLKAVSGPVIIVAGACNARIDQQLENYRGLLFAGFKNYTGTIISGGTTAGISGLVGDVQQQRKGSIKTVGYVPRLTTAEATIDTRYTTIRKTDGTNFSPLEAVAYWGDLIASGVAPSSVKLIGIEGGDISAAEYRIALALGASVGIIEGSGHEAAKLLADKDWNASPNLLPLPPDAFTLRAFIGPGALKLEPETREAVARAIHEEYLESQQQTRINKDPSMADWEKLKDNLKESNRQQADDISSKLHEIGCTIHEVGVGTVSLMHLTDDEIERLAEVEHARWMIERLRDGWVWGPEKSIEEKVSPYLLPWHRLSEEVKEWDRNTVREIPQYLARVGIEVRRDTEQI